MKSVSDRKHANPFPDHTNKKRCLGQAEPGARGARRAAAIQCLPITDLDDYFNILIGEESAIRNLDDIYQRPLAECDLGPNLGGLHDSPLDPWKPAFTVALCDQSASSGSLFTLAELSKVAPSKECASSTDGSHIKSFTLDERPADPLAFALPNLGDITFGVFEDSSTRSSASLQANPIPTPALDGEPRLDEPDTATELPHDPFTSAPFPHTNRQDIPRLEWDRFYTQSQPSTSRRIPLSERGPDAFDAAVQKHSSETGASAGSVVRLSILLPCLLNLGRGYSSILWSFSRDTDSPQPTLKHIRIPGHSLQASESLISTISLFGRQLRALRACSFFSKGNPAPSPVQLALTSAGRSIESAVQGYLNKALPAVRSTAELGAVFETILPLLNRVASTFTAVSLHSNEVPMLDALFAELENVDQNDRSSQLVLTGLLKVASWPILDWVAARIGLTCSEGAAECTGFPQDGRLSRFQLPLFLREGHLEDIIQAERCMQILKVHCPAHQLCSPASFQSTSPPGLGWAFSWEEVDAGAAEIELYRQRLRSESSGQFDHAKLEDTGHVGGGGSQQLLVEGDDARRLQSEIETMNGEPVFPHRVNSKLQQSVSQAIHLLKRDENDGNGVMMVLHLSPPLSLVPPLSFGPLIKCQADLLNRAVLRHMLSEADLRLHLDVQKRCHMFGDADFLSQLTTALFESEVESAERKRGSLRLGGRMGLKVGSRSSWPPASSELRLVLAGILSDNHRQWTLGRSPGGGTQGWTLSEPECDLSFSIRQLPEWEIQRVLEPNSIYALEFLKIHYRPPEPLGQVISEQTLEGYDAIFRHLLRLVRVEYATKRQMPLPQGSPGVGRAGSGEGGRLSRNELRRLSLFRLQVQTFVATYFFHISEDVIGPVWAAFVAEVDAVSAALDGGSSGPSRLAGGPGMTVEGLRLLHERCVGTILQGLFLLVPREREPGGKEGAVEGQVRERIGAMARQVEVLLSLCLRFSVLCSADADADAGTAGWTRARLRDAFELQADFEAGVRVFLGSCRESAAFLELTGHEGCVNAAGRVFGPADMMARDMPLALLARLEAGGYWG